MNRKIFFLVNILLATLLVLALWQLVPSTNTPTYSLGSHTLTIPSLFQVTQKQFTFNDWAPNGYCRDHTTNTGTCQLLIIQDQSEHSIVLSTPHQFGILVSDAQECFKENNRTIQLGKQSIQITEYYHNIEQITYHPKRIDHGQNPYDCSQVQISDTNFHHLTGCKNDLCIWADKSLSLEQFNNLTSQIQISNQ